MRLKFFVLKTFIQVRFVQKIITFTPLMLWVANRLQTTNIKISSRLVSKLKMHLSSHSLISCAKNSPVKPWLLWPRQNYWKVMHATKPFHPPHISIEQCIRSFYYFGAFVSTPSPFSTEFLGDVIWTPAFPPAPRDLKPIDLAAKSRGLGISQMIEIILSWTRMQFGHGNRCKIFHEQLKTMLFILISLSQQFFSWIKR